jgi:urease accessory protein
VSRRWGLGGATVLALVMATPAPVASVVDELRSLAAAAPPGDAAGVTVLGGETLVCRYLGGSAERARAFVHDSWRRLRPAVLGRPAVAPRIWAT